MPPASNPFLTTLPKLRRVLTRVQDTPQRIAARELGNASRWAQIVQINGLQPPYLTDDPSLASDTVLLAGQDSIQVPNDDGPAKASAATDAATTYGTDMKNAAGFLVDNGAGDIALVSGVANFTQALKIRLDTPLGDLLFHLGYGNGAHGIRGRGNSPQLLNLANVLAQRCVASDDRVSSTKSFTAKLSGDSIKITGVAVTVDGTPLDVTYGS